MMPQLVLRMPGGATRVWALSADPLSLGRDAQCTLRVNDSSVSRRHCEIWIERGEAFVRDLGSSNATLVNGEPVSDTRRLLPGDFLGIGDTQFEIREDLTPASDDEPTTAILKSVIPDEFQGELDSEFLQPTPNTVRELFQLYVLSKRLASVETLEELADYLWGFLSEVLSIDAGSLGILVASSSPLALAPTFNFPDTFRSDVDSGALELLAVEQAPIPCHLPGVRDIGAQKGYHVPVLHNDDMVAVVSVLRGRGVAPIDASDIRLIRAAAELVAPHIRAIERLMQHERDEHRLRQIAGVPQGLIGESAPMQETREALARVAPSRIHVLILGETGTGKELAARTVHEQSDRAHGPFVVVNCAAIPEELFESQLFGHEAGAFTGARGRHRGYIEEANGGTLFLDEVGELSLSNQARLLRAVESGAIRRVGGTQDFHVDVRYLSATNRDLHNRNALEFREDLYFRLCGMPVEMPSLRARPEDIPALVRHFQATAHGGGGPGTQFTERAWAALTTHDWPGNIRELRQVIDRLSLFHGVGPIDAADIEGALFPSRRQTEKADGLTRGEVPATAPLNVVEQHHIERALRYHAGNVTATANSLEINRITLYRRLKRYEQEGNERH